MKLLLQLRSKKQNFWKKLLKLASLKMKICCFFRSLLPHVNNKPANLKLHFRNRIQQVVDQSAYPPASSTFQHCPFALSPSSPPASSTLNSLSSEAVASPPATPQDTRQNYQIYHQTPPFWSSSKSHQYPMSSKVFWMPYFFLKHYVYLIKY